MNVNQVSRLGRHLDLRLTSNRIAVLGPLLIGGSSLAWDAFSSDRLDYLDAGLAAISSFLAWAIARELDPDRNSTATLALVLAGAAALFTSWEGPMLISAVALVGVRALSGTVGGELKPADLVVMVGAAAYAGSRTEGWVVVLLLLLAVLDSRPPGYLWVTLLMVVASVGAALFFEVALPVGPWPDEVFLWALVAVVSVALASRKTRIWSRTDLYDHPILWPKVRASRVMAGFVVLGGLLASDSETVVLLVPVLCGLTATALLRTFRPI